MAGLVPAIHVFHHLSMAGYVYFLSNRPNGTLYVGVTTDLIRRVYEHRTSAIKGFSKQYGLKLLVYYEVLDDVRDAIQREKTIKHWPRAWKVRKIMIQNPNWNDLYPSLT